MKTKAFLCYGVLTINNISLSWCIHYRFHRYHYQLSFYHDHHDPGI